MRNIVIRVLYSVLIFVGYARAASNKSGSARYFLSKLGAVEVFAEIGLYGAYKFNCGKYDAVFCHDPITFAVLLCSDIQVLKVVDIVEVINFKGRFGDAYKKISSIAAIIMTKMAVRAAKEACYRLTPLVLYKTNVEKKIGITTSLRNAHLSGVVVSKPQAKTNKILIVAANHQNNETMISELILASDKYSERIELLIGVPITPKKYLSKVEELVGKRPWVKKLDEMPHQDLLTVLASCDVGICVFRGVTENGKYASPNRLYDYITAEIPIVASPFGDAAQIIQEYGNGLIMQGNDPESIIDAAVNIGTTKKEYEKQCSLAQAYVIWERDAVIFDEWRKKCSADTRWLIVAPKTIEKSVRLTKIRAELESRGWFVDTLVSAPGVEASDVLQKHTFIKRGRSCAQVYVPKRLRLWFLSAVNDIIKFWLRPENYLQRKHRMFGIVCQQNESLLSAIYRIKKYQDAQ